MTSEYTKILEFNQYEKSDKIPFIIYSDLQCIIKKINWSKYHPENLSAIKVSEHIQSGFSMSTMSSFRSIENKPDVCRGKDFMKKFLEFLREQEMKTIIFKKEKRKLLTKEQQKSYDNGKICYICKGNLKINVWKINNILKIEIIVII